MMRSEDDQRLHALLRDHAARLTPAHDLRDRILASAPGHARRLDVLLGQSRRAPVPPSLSDRILAAAPLGGWPGFLASLWPFGPVWRPAMGLAILAVLGVLLGTSGAAVLDEPVSVNGALSEEVFVLALGGSEAFE